MAEETDFFKLAQESDFFDCLARFMMRNMPPVQQAYLLEKWEECKADDD